MAKKVRVRFAPSPTGFLHVGNVRTALLNFLFSRSKLGEFWLRLDDTDTHRSRPEYEQAIYEDLKWLGLNWDNFNKQSSRYKRYGESIEHLKEKGRLYACYETAQELVLKRKIQLGRGLPPVYDREGYHLTKEQKMAYENEGRRPHWRFFMKDGPIMWNDLSRGEVRFEAGHLSDPVLIREDGRPLYTLSSVVDDGDLMMSHIIRGEDHVSNTAVQIQLFEALGFEIPQFSHTPLLVDEDGKGLSKRLGSLGIRTLRKEGLEPLTILTYLARIGTSKAADGKETLEGLWKNFSFSEYGRASPRFSIDEMKVLNGKRLHAMNFNDISVRLTHRGLEGVTQQFWDVIKGNINNISEVKDWYDIVYGTLNVTPNEEDREYLLKVSELLPKNLLQEDFYKTWISALKSQTGRKGRYLFMPLRIALTGKTQGPELHELIPIIGYEKAIKRLKA